MRLLDTIARWVGRVEIVLAGADEDLRSGEESLAAGDAMRARGAAHRVLSRAPDSPLGLALLADACDAGGLDAELALTLETLAERVPSRAEVWVRLGRARQATAAPDGEVRDAFVRALAVAEAGSEARRDALLALADLDLAEGDGARAELWLRRTAETKAPDVAVRRAEARLLLGDATGATRALSGAPLSPTDGRGALALGRALAQQQDGGAFPLLLRAMVLDVPGASEALSSALAWVPCDDGMRTRIRSVVDAKDEDGLARWRAAFARASGDRASARRALREAAEAGDEDAANALLDSAFEDQDPASLEAAVARTSRRDPSRDDAPRLLAVVRALADGGRPGSEALDTLRALRSPRSTAWATALAERLAEAWIPASGAPASWSDVLERLDAHARGLADLETIERLAEIARERARPVRVAVVGEFNAGKSTFINALIGQEVAPMGVLPTTATLHHLRYAPDPIARIFFAPPHDPPERIVPVGELRSVLRALEDAPIRRVEVMLPLASLTRVEILDTPGFNAPHQAHTEAARRAFEEADFAIWLLDAAQAMKQSERVVLEEARAARLPVQMLVNKADRLNPASLDQVMRAVTDALAESSLSSWVAPLALSAKRALAGKLGDEAALAASGWAAVQALLDEQIVARSAELKERALRRRAASAVERLFARAAHLADDERRADDEERARVARVAEAAAQLDERGEDAEADVARALDAPIDAWKRDVELAVIGQGPDAVARDRVLARYRVDRALAHLAPPLAGALAGLVAGAGGTPIAAAELPAVARALVRAAAAASPPRAFRELAAPLATAAIATLEELLVGLLASPPRRATGTGLLRELAALRKALA